MHIRTRGARYQCQVKFPDGTTRTRTFNTHALATAWGREIETRRAAGERVDAATERTTLGQAWASFRALRVSEGLAPNTLAKNDVHWRVHLAPAFGDKAVRSIRHTDVRAWVAASRRAGVGVPTVEASLRLLHGMLALAVHDGLILNNPATGVKPGDHLAAEKAIPTRAEMRAIVAAIPNPHDALLVDLLATTGMRIGEALGLRAMDVDPGEGVVTVRRTWTRHGWKPGTKAGEFVYRSVPVPARLMSAITATPRIGAVPLFVGDDRNLNRRVLARACNVAGVPVVTLHGLRHYATTQLIDAGHTPLQVQKIMGWADGRMLQTRYAHMTTGAYDDVRRTMEAMEANGL